MQEEWVRWEPTEGLAGKYDVESLSDNERGICIRLCPDKKEYSKIDLLFTGYGDSYRHTNETFGWKLCSDLAEKYGKDFYGEWSLFKVNNSEYLKWLRTQSNEYTDRFLFTHFCIIGTNSIIDILSYHEPEVIVINEGI